jgi:hypothetical protein
VMYNIFFIVLIPLPRSPSPWERGQATKAV